jgi:hypothetical protein
MLEGLTPPSKARQCAVTKLLVTLSKTDKVILEDALANTQAWSSNGLSMSLKERGIILGDFTITKHRNKACLCFRS